jgi:hypothetical protein
MPWGETVVGIVLEDLCAESIALHDYCEEKKGTFKIEDDVDPLVRLFPSHLYFSSHPPTSQQFTAAFELLERLHSLGITGFQPDTFDIRIIKSSSPSDLHLVWIDFGGSISVEARTASHDQRAAQMAAMGMNLGPWHRHEATRLENLFNLFFKGTRVAWSRRELTEGREGAFRRLVEGGA